MMIHYPSLEIVPYRINIDNPSSDPLFLEKIKQTNDEVKKLIDDYEL